MAAEDEREAKRKRYTSRLITIQVGAAKDELTVHEDILSEESPFFKAALERKWKEGNAGTIELPDDEMDTIIAYVHWLHRNEIVKYIDDDGRAEYNFLAKLYVYGEKVQSDNFCNAVLSTMLQACDVKIDRGAEFALMFPGVGVVKIIYKGTPAGSLMRRCLVEMYAEAMGQKWFSENSRVFPREFLADLAVELMVRIGNPQFGSFYERRAVWDK